MKKKGRRAAAILLAAALMLWALPLGAMAAESGCSVMLENREGLGTGGVGLNIQRTFGAAPGAYDAGDLYSQLSVRQKACYDALEEVTIQRISSAAQVESNGRAYRRLIFHIPGMDNLPLTGTFSNGLFTPSAASKDAEAGIYTDLCAAIVALRYDRPDILWMGYMRYGYKVTQAGGGVKVSGVMIDFHLEYGGREKAMGEVMMENAQAIADKASQASTTYEKVKAIHDLLAEGSSYGDPDEPISHLAYSALVTGDSYEPVCDGYSKAFKIVCDLMDIPCAIPSSNDHMWNNVRMDDGDWYNVDLTWDDDGEELIYDYFLIGSQTEVGGTAFSKQPYHVENNPYEDYRRADPSGSLKAVTMRFPTKNKKAYEPLGQDYSPLSFDDVKRSSWYYQAVEDVYQKGLFHGDDNGLFLPDKNITRAEFALVMSKALHADISGFTVSPFTDVPAGKWYTAAVAWAKAAGLMRGDGNGIFRPGSPITRQEMCVVLYSALRTHREPGSFQFPDDQKISSWARTAVYGCYAEGLLAGDEKGNFDPRGNTLRSHAATIFSKFTGLDVIAPEIPGPDEPGTDEPGTDEPGTDEPGTDEPGTDEPGTDEPGTDEPGTDEPVIDDPTVVDRAEGFGSTVVELEEGVFVAPAYTGSFTDYYSQLSPRQQACYRAMESVGIDRILSSSEKEIDGKTYYKVIKHIPEVDGTPLSYVSSGGKLVLSASSEAAKNEIFSDLRSARMALRYDRPELLWMENLAYSYETEQVSGYDHKISSLVLYFHLEFDGQEKAMYDTMMKNAQEIAAEASLAPDTYSRVKAVHDRLALGNVYAARPDGEPVSAEESPVSYTAYSALVSGDQWEPVCQGYANAFKIVCDLLDIPCCLAVSWGHRWNNVKMDDGLWYNLDLTWDDGEGENIAYDYFLVGSETPVYGAPFSSQQDHAEVSITDRYLEVTPDAQYALLRYPVKSKTAYEYLGRDYPQPTFYDVGREAWFYDAVEWAAERGIVSGTNLHAFHPMEACTRAQAVALLWRAAGSPEPQNEEMPFTDVPENTYYRKAVQWAVEQGIASGTDPDRFSPRQSCDRGQIVAFLYRYAGRPAVTEASPFTDTVPGHFYYDAVRWAVENRVTSGVSDTRFAPAELCSRCQVVSFLYRYLGK